MDTAKEVVKMRKATLVVLLLIAIALLPACAGTAEPTATPVPHTPTAAPTPAVSPLEKPTADPAEVLRGALAKELGVSETKVKVVRVAPKDAFSSALFEGGCKRVDLDPAPALPSGKAVLLTVGPESYVYYRDDGGWMRCGPSRAHLPAVGVPRAGDRQQMVYMAKEDLSKRLGISVDSISVERVDQVDWPDSSLGCPEPGKVYAQVITPGYRILLKADGKTYEYHSGAMRVLHCEAGR